MISKQPTDWKRPWCWERLKAKAKEGVRGWGIGWHHEFNGRELEQTPGDSEGQGDLACCNLWGCKFSDWTTASKACSVLWGKRKKKKYSKIKGIRSTGRMGRPGCSIKLGDLIHTSQKGIERLNLNKDLMTMKMLAKQISLRLENFM